MQGCAYIACQPFIKIVFFSKSLSKKKYVKSISLSITKGLNIYTIKIPCMILKYIPFSCEHVQQKTVGNYATRC